MKKNLMNSLKKTASVGLAIGIIASGSNVNKALADTEDANISVIEGENTVDAGDGAIVDDSGDVADEAANDETNEEAAVDENAEESAVDETADESATEDAGEAAEDNAADEAAANGDSVSENASEEESAGEDATPGASAEADISYTASIQYFANNAEAEVIFDDISGEFITEAISPVAEYVYAISETAYIAEPDEDITKDGYAFVGWSVDPKATEPDYQPGDEIVIERGLNLYAVWLENAAVAREIVYFANGATFGSAPQDDFSPYVYGDKADILYPWGMTREGFNFAGWSTNPFATVPDFAFDADMHAETTVDKTLRLYAVWETIKN